MNQTIIHNEIHTSVSAHFASFLADLFAEGVFIHFQQRVESLLADKLMRIGFQSDPRKRIFLSETFRTAYHVNAVIGTRTGNVVLYHDGFPFGGTNKSRVHILAGNTMFGCIKMHTLLRIRHGNQRSHAVAPVNVQYLGDRT